MRCSRASLGREGLLAKVFASEQIEVQHLIPIEDVTPAEGAFGQKMWEPVDVVRPHLLERDLVEVEPLGAGLVGLGWLALIVARAEHIDEESVSIDELKLMLATPSGCFGADA